ncbi:MAG: PKD domain-containing protein, partial [Actinobacteria bacterium]|nr:PKD domain-containing protein [Actinomycetota bacterium]
MSVTKVAPADAAAVTFTFTITCPGAVGSPFTTTVTGSGTSAPITGIATGTVCTATETTAPGFDPQPDQTFPAVATGVTQTVTFVNSRVPPPPTITVTKTASPTSRPAPGGTFVFVVAVVNTGSTPVTTNGLADDVYGDLDGLGTCVTGSVLAPGAIYTCSFTGVFTGSGGDSQTDTVTASALDGRGRVTAASASATVRVIGAPTAKLTAAPTRGRASLAVSFDGSTSAAGVGATVTSWTLDFGEGPPVSGTGSPPPATGSHIYAGPGSHTATLTVTQSDGQSASAQASVLVTNPHTSLAMTPTPASGQAPLGVLYSYTETNDGNDAI